MRRREEKEKWEDRMNKCYMIGVQKDTEVRARYIGLK